MQIWARVSIARPPPQPAARPGWPPWGPGGLKPPCRVVGARSPPSLLWFWAGCDLAAFTKSVSGRVGAENTPAWASSHSIQAIV